MTNREARAVCALLHALLDNRRIAFYAFTHALGHDLSGTSELGTVAYEQEPYVTPRAVAFFRAVADALEGK